MSLAYCDERERFDLAKDRSLISRKSDVHCAGWSSEQNARNSSSSAKSKMLSIRKVETKQVGNPEIYQTLAHKVLGECYDLSLVFCRNKLAAELKLKHLRSSEPANVLSFPLSDESGEIFINTELLSRESQELGQTEVYRSYYLFIHGLLHLKGWSHGSKMENEEERLLSEMTT